MYSISNFPVLKIIDNSLFLELPLYTHAKKKTFLQHLLPFLKVTKWKKGNFPVGCSWYNVAVGLTCIAAKFLVHWL